MIVALRRLEIARLWRDQKGATAVEFSICGAILIALSLGVIEIGRAFLVRNELAYAADRATRTVLMDPSASDSTIAAAARAAFQDDLSLLVVAVAEETVDGLPSRVITLSYPIDLLLPLRATSGFDLSVSRRISTGE